jgi:hypothetical protein
VYCLIHETPPLEWGISGVPMPDLPYLTGERRAEEIRRANQLMNEMQAQAQQRQQQQPPPGNPPTT